jgi:hypothetical protein
MTDEPTVDASAVPQWWKEIFPAGARKGFYRREGGLTVTFIDREAARLVVTIEAGPGGHGASRADRVIDPILSARGWSHLIVQFADSRDATDRVQPALDALSQDGLFDRVTQIDMLGIGAGADLLLALDGRFAATRKVAICPTAVPGPWPEGAGPVTLMTTGPMGSGPVETTLPAGSMLLRLPAGIDPLARIDAAELADEIIGAALEGTLDRDSFDDLVEDSRARPDPRGARRETHHRSPGSRLAAGTRQCVDAGKPRRRAALHVGSLEWPRDRFRGAPRKHTGPDAARDARDHRHRRRLRRAPPPR